jgi:hypothetical protein
VTINARTLPTAERRLTDKACKREGDTEIVRLLFFGLRSCVDLVEIKAGILTIMMSVAQSPMEPFGMMFI